jgi:hypothetical protein
MRSEMGTPNKHQKHIIESIIEDIHIERLKS